MTARKPDSLKLVTGTFRPDRAAPGPALPALDAVPERPSWLTDVNAVKEWQRLVTVMAANKLLNAGNVGLLAQLCALHGLLVKIWAAGNVPTAALIASYRGLSGCLGLLSMSMPASPGAKPNRFLKHVKGSSRAKH